VLPVFPRFSASHRRPSRRFAALGHQTGRSLLVLLALLLLWCVCLGLGLAQAAKPAIAAAPDTPEIAALSEAAYAEIILAKAGLAETGLGEPAARPPTPPAAETANPIPASRRTAGGEPGSETSGGTAMAQAAPIGTVDSVGDRFQAGQQLYLQTCATCHFAIPPAVFPSETWRQLLLDPQHYGATLTPLQNPNLRLVWDYLKTYSRPEATNEELPFRVYQSRYFKILHPKVKLPTRVGLANCLSCHPGGAAYDFRSVSAEWQNAP
jgi:hypothetical protein